MEKRGLLKQITAGIFLSVCFSLFFVLPASSLEVNQEYILGSSVKLDLSKYENYVLKIETPSSTFIKQGNKDNFLFTPEETGEHALILESGGKTSVYSFLVKEEGQNTPSETKETVAIQQSYVAVLNQPVRWEKEAGAIVPQYAFNVSSSNSSVVYYTPAPRSTEEKISSGKIVRVSSQEHYENVLIFSSLDESLQLKDSSRITIYWVEQKTYLPAKEVKDTDGNGIYDYVEWIAPHLSDQTFIIKIISAHHLDSGKTFLRDIYSEVSELDGIFSETIGEGEYVRVTFEKQLDGSKDITVFPKIISGSPRIDIYEAGGSTLVASLTELTEGQPNKALLSALQGSQDSFDLRVSEGSVQFDQITDPSWYSALWDYRRNITISGGTGAGTNHQVLLRIGESASSSSYDFHLAGHSADFPSETNDGGDLRFTSDDGITLLDFWVESVTGSSGTRTARVWVEVGASLATSKQIYVYYGNAGASSLSNGNSTFDFFDSFDDGTLTDTWSIDSENQDGTVYIDSTAGLSGGALRHDPDSSQTKNAYFDTRIITSAYQVQDGILEYDVFLAGAPRIIHQMGYRTSSLAFTDGYSWRLQNSAADGGFFEFASGAWTAFGTAYPAVSGSTWYHVTINISGSNYGALVSPGSSVSASDASKTTAGYLTSHVHGVSLDSSSYILVDNVRVRKYSAVQPVFSSAATEESFDDYVPELEFSVALPAFNFGSDCSGLGGWTVTGDTPVCPGGTIGGLEADADTFNITSPAIDTTGLSNIWVSFEYAEDAATANEIMESWFSVDGGTTWERFFFISSGAATSTDNEYLDYRASLSGLDPAVENNPDLRLKFGLTSSNSADELFINNIEVSGNNGFSTVFYEDFYEPTTGIPSDSPECSSGTLSSNGWTLSGETPVCPGGPPNPGGIEADGDTFTLTRTFDTTGSTHVIVSVIYSDDAATSNEQAEIRYNAGSGQEVALVIDADGGTDERWQFFDVVLSDIDPAVNNNSNLEVTFFLDSPNGGDELNFGNIALQSITTKTAGIPPTVQIYSPVNNSIYGPQDFPLNVTALLNKPGQAVFYSLDNGITNFSMSGTDGYNWNASIASLASGSYSLRIFAEAEDGTTNGQESVNFVADFTPPSIVLNSPLNSSVQPTPVLFNWTATDSVSSTLYCDVISNSGVIAENISSPSGVSTISSVSALSSGLNLWNITCTDEMGNTNTSQTRTFIVPPIEYNVQRGSASVDGEVNVTINSVNPEKAFIMHSVRASDSGPDTLHVVAEFINSTTIRFRNYGGASADVEWEVITGEAILVQRGLEAAASGTSSMDVDISQVNLSSSFVLVSSRLSTGTNNQYVRGLWTASFSNASRILLQRDTTGSAGEVAWQVVSWSGASVQSGSVSSGAASASSSLSTQVDLASSFLVFSKRISGSTALNSFNLGGFLSNSTIVSFYREGGGGTINAEWFVVSHPLLVAQRGSVNTIDSLPLNVSIDTLTNINKSFNSHSRSSTGGGSTNANSVLTSAIIDNSVLQLITGTDPQTQNVSWYVVEISSEPVLSNVLVFPITGTEATINWNTNTFANATIKYGNSTSLGLTISNSSLSKNHSVLISGLIESTTYFYNITSCNSAGCTEEGPYNFTTFEEDVFPPVVSLLSPENETTITDSFDFEFVFSVDDYSNIVQCSIQSNGASQLSMSSVAKNVNQTFYLSVPNGVATWAVTCTDSEGNVGYSENRTLNVNVAPYELSDRFHETGGTGQTANNPAIIFLNNSNDASQKTAEFTFAGNQLINMVNATSHVMGNNGAVISSGASTTFSSSFTVTSTAIRTTWKLYVLNSTGETLICQWGDDDSGGANVNSGTISRTNNTCFSSDYRLAPSDRLKLFINGYNNNANPRSVTHAWDGAASSYVDLDISTEGFLNASLVSPPAPLNVQSAEAFNLTCQVSCTIGTCSDVNVYAQVFSSSWQNISSSGNIVLASGQSNPVSLADVSTSPVNATFTLQSGSITSANQVRCVAVSSYDLAMSDPEEVNVAGVPKIYFTPPTHSNGSSILVNHFPVNITIEESSLESFTFNLDGQNYSFPVNILELFYSDNSSVDYINIQNPFPLSGVMSTTVDPSLVLAFNFDNKSEFGDTSTTVADLSNYNQNGTINGATFTQNGKVGGAFSYPGGTQRITVPSFDKLNGENEVTISAWVNQSAVTTDQYLVWADGNVLIQFGDTFNLVGASNLRVRWNLQGDWRNSHTAVGALDADTWNHWAFVFSSGTTRIYKNGVNIYNGTDTQTTFSPVSPNFEIGARDSGGFEGIIDEFRVWDRALTPSEIQNYYASNLYKESGSWQFFANLTNVPDGEHTYYGYAENLASVSNQTEVRHITIDTTQTLPPAITVISPIETTYSSVPIWFNVSLDKSGDWCAYSLDGGANVSMNEVNSAYFASAVAMGSGQHSVIFSCNSTFGLMGTSSPVNFFVDASAPSLNFVSPTPANAATLTVNYTQTNVSITEDSLTKFIWNWNQTNYSLYDDSLVLMMSLDNRSSIGENSSLAVDVSPMAHEGTFLGNAVPTPSGKHHYAASFDGTNDWIQIPDHSSLDGMSGFTFEAWVFDTANDAQARGIGSKRVDSTNQRAWAIFSHTNRYINFDVGSERHDSGVALPSGQWVHLVVTFNGSAPSGQRKMFYYNGQLVATRASAATSIPSTNSELHIGILNAAYGVGWQGRIDEVKVYNRTLSAADINGSYSSNLYKYDSDSWFFSANLTGLQDGLYSYRAFGEDAFGRTSSTELRTLSINTNSLAPNIVLNSPANNSLSTSSSVSFNFTATDSFDSSFTCSLYAGDQSDLGFTVSNGTSVSRTINNIKDGLQIWNVTCINSAMITGQSENRVINISVSPAVALNTANNSFFNVSDFSLAYTPTDNTGFQSCEAFIDGVSSATNQSAITNGAVNYLNVTDVEEGFHNWTVTCTDVVGLTAQSETRYFTVDLDGLSIELLYPPSGAELFTDTVIFSYNATDNFSPLLACSIVVNSEVVNFFNAASGAITNRSVTFDSGGFMLWNVTCTDSSLNSFTSETRNFTLAFPPQVVLQSPEHNSFHNISQISLVYFVSDDNNNIVNSTLILNGQQNMTNQSEILNDENNNFTLSFQDGVYNWTVEVTDLTSLTGTDLSTRTFTIDTAAPLVNLVSPVNASILDWNEVEINFTTIDNLDSLLSCELVVNGDIEFSFNASSGVYTNISLLRDDGSYDWYIGCLDDSGNYNVSQAQTFTVEAPPRVTLFSPENQSYLNISSTNFIYLPEDAIGVSECSLYIDGILNQTSSTITVNQNNSFSADMQEGHHNWTVECIDVFPDFNTFSPPVNEFFTDFTPPLVTLSEPLNSSNTLKQVAFNFSVTDSLSQSLTCSLYVDGILNVSGEVVQSGSSYQASLGNYSLGQHTWNVSCFDEAYNVGQSGSWQFNVTLPDFKINSSDIYFSNDNPTENETVTIYADVHNLVNVTAYNVSVLFFDRNPSEGGVQIGSEQVIPSLSQSNYTVSVDWQAELGTTDIYVIVDQQNSIEEWDKTNNNATRPITVGSWHFFYGFMNEFNQLELADSENSSITKWRVLASNDIKIFAADSESSISWSNLEAMGRNAVGGENFASFAELDDSLGMAGFVDSVSELYTDGASAIDTRQFMVFGSLINNVPVAASINSSSFVTGILWDTSLDSNGFYDSTEKEDLVFFTQVNQSQPGAHGVYDYELRVPAKLREYIDVDSRKVFFYTEII